MCELFAVSSENPVRLTYELSEFATHGGQRFHNRDGWGILFSQPRDAYLYKEPSAGATSALEHMVATQPPLSRMIMAHVRRATTGIAALCNTHPFERAVHGQKRSFAHNGDLPELRAQYAGSPEISDCVGETDSELAFMILLARLARLNASATYSDRFEIFAEFCHDMRRLGDCNFLYAEGETLFVHADKRVYEESSGRLTEPRPPGLHLGRIPAEQRRWQVKGAAIEKVDSGAQLLIASVPLDEGYWTGLPQGSALLVKNGEEHMRAIS